jgi:hypothetical protein
MLVIGMVFAYFKERNVVRICLKKADTNEAFSLVKPVPTVEHFPI